MNLYYDKWIKSAVTSEDLLRPKLNASRVKFNDVSLVVCHGINPEKETVVASNPLTNVTLLYIETFKGYNILCMYRCVCVCVCVYVFVCVCVYNEQLRVSNPTITLRLRRILNTCRPVTRLLLCVSAFATASSVPSATRTIA
uniref:Uncharacterized protein n=1 Tax=Glossina pallidipes TaxID=7398 RepID=A0A1A9ZR93_GLOPL